MPTVFYATYSTDEHAAPDDEIHAEASALPDLLRKHLRYNGDFFGITDDDGTTLQFMKGGGDRVALDLPDPDEGGSYVQPMTVDQAAELLAQTPPPYAALRAVYPFRRWDAPVEATPFAIAAEEIQPLVDHAGAALATAMVTRFDSGIRYCYRETPADEADSGWLFFSGHETQEYLDDPTNTGVHSLNTIANFDPDIIPLLDAPPGSAFERTHMHEPFRPIDRGE